MSITQALQRASMRTAAHVHSGRVFTSKWSLEIEGLTLQMETTDHSDQRTYTILWDDFAPMEGDHERITAVMLSMEDRTLAELTQ